MREIIFSQLAFSSQALKTMSSEPLCTLSLSALAVPEGTLDNLSHIFSRQNNPLDAVPALPESPLTAAAAPRSSSAASFSSI